jgi:hypothetical protein
MIRAHWDCLSWKGRKWDLLPISLDSTGAFWLPRPPLLIKAVPKQSHALMNHLAACSNIPTSMGKKDYRLEIAVAPPARDRLSI